MHLVYSVTTESLTDWEVAAEAAHRHGAEAAALTIAPDNLPAEATLDAYDRNVPAHPVPVTVLHAAGGADFPAVDALPGDRADIRHMVALKRSVALAARLGVSFLTLESWAPEPAAVPAYLLDELGRYAGRHRVRIPAAFGKTSPDEVRRRMLARRANAVGWLYEPGALAAAGEDPVAALERAGDFIYIARVHAADIAEESYDITRVLRELGAWFDGPVEIACRGEAQYAEAAARIGGLVPALTELRSPSDYTKMSFPSSVGRLLNGEGAAEITPNTPQIAGAHGTWQLRYTTGSSGLRQGARVHIRPGHASDWPPGQTHDPAAENYLTVRLTEGDAVVKVRPTRMAAATQGIELFVEQGEIPAGVAIEVTIGDTSGGGPGHRCQCFEEEEFRLFVAVDREGDGLFRELPDPPSFPVVGGAPANAVLVAPAVVRPGEPFSVLVRLEDPWHNVATEGFAPALRLSADGVEHVPESLEWPDPNRALAWIHGVRCDDEGIHYLHAEDPASGVRGNSTPIKCAAHGPRVYWGDIHAHSAQMDGTSTPEQSFEYARDVARLDFFSLADHVDIDTDMCELSTPEQWQNVLECTKRFHDPGQFVTLLGYEIAEDNGDYNVYYRTDDAPWYIPASNVWELFRWLRTRRLDAVVIPHMSSYPVATRGYDFNYWDPELMPLAEVYSYHGNSEYFGAPRPLQTCEPGGYVQDALARGHKLGFIGSGDGHHAKPGNTADRYDSGIVAVFAKSLDRDSIFDALQQRHCYAATTARMLLEFSINGVPMGQDCTLWEPARIKHLRFTAAGTAPLTRVEVVKNNEVWRIVEPNTLSHEDELTDEAPTHRTDYYYVRVTQEDGHTAWSSPIWVSAGDRLPVHVAR